MQNERLKYLYDQYIKADATEAELQELMSMANEPEHEKEFHALMEGSWMELEEIEERISQAGKTKVVPLYRRAWFRIASAAAVIFAIATTWYLTQKGPQSTDTPTASTPTQQPNDVAPGKNGAILTLADGRKIVLDDAADGNVTDNAVKDGDQLSYSTNNQPSTTISYNTMSTPNGRQYSLVLSDGTKVWLNAASSITFPTAFAGNERRVQVTGEAYFEVAKDATKPFHVTTKEQDIEVLGTHFNINSYDDEDAIRTTLLEGSVKVQSRTKADVSVVLKPGQQAELTLNSKLITLNPDIDVVMSWKNGLFNFTNADITEIMKQAARWYDVEVKYQGTISKDKFKGKISRNTNLSQLLKILEINGVKWKIEGRTVTVTN